MSTPGHGQMDKTFVSLQEQTKNALREETDEAEAQETDNYCSMCDDGGALVICSICSAACCYNELNEDDLELEEAEAPTSLPCVTLPHGYLENVHRIFRCPGCLSQNPARTIDYIINRGSRSTQRVAVTARIVIIVACLPELLSRGQHIFGAIQSQLGSFEVMATCFYISLTASLSARDKREILSSDGGFHFVFTFLTESNPSGGWWFESGSEEGKPGVQAEESLWLYQNLHWYDEIAKKSISARIFGICCGINMSAPDVVGNIVEGFKQLNWNSMILPAAPSVSPEEYGSILPELFTQLYYNGLPLRSSLLRVWAKSRRARVHTDLFVIDRIERAAEPLVQKYIYAPESSRPWGIDLPVCWSFCRCPKEENSRWRKIFWDSKLKFGEQLVCYRSQCGHVDLHIAIYVQDVTKCLRAASGTSVLLQNYNPELRSFPFDGYNRFHIKITTHPDREKTIKPTARKGNTDHYGQKHESPWTEAGKNA